VKILQYLHEHLPQILQDIEDLVKRESPSQDKRLAEECARFLQGLMLERLGVQMTAIPNEQVGPHLKFLFGEGKGRVMILAHYDTVWPQGTLPIRAEKDRLYGPGVLDMKAGIIQAVWSLKAIHDLHLSLNSEILFLLTSDEEIFSNTSRALIEEEAKRCKAVFVVEPAAAPSQALKIARKGAAKYVLTVHGISSHAGNHPDVEASAVHEAAHQIIRLEQLARPDIGTTINVGVISGGTLSNVVADFARLEVDVRFKTLAEGERVHRQITGLKPVLKRTRLDIEGQINRPPLEPTEQSKRLFQLAQQIAAKLGFQLGGEEVGGVSDGNFTAALGVPTLDGLGAVGEGPHAHHEHILIAEVPKRSALLAHLLLSV